uniref:Uncharacterized protein n=1 Tax=Siphoviridae sp. ctt1f11 TaxID=2827959 RepID=A0A8S5SCZ1_9CAUD|nr:MAG TPA: hypothetical protein [Siphoviridae sp. ctt1f11]
MRGEQKSAGQGQDDGDNLGGARPAAVAQAHPDDDENEAEVLEDGARPGVRCADDLHVANLTGGEAEERVDDEGAPVARARDELTMGGGDPTRASQGGGDGEHTGSEHATEANEGELNAVAGHQIVGGHTGGAPAEGGHNGHNVPDGIAHETPPTVPPRRFERPTPALGVQQR